MFPGGAMIECRDLCRSRRRRWLPGILVFLLLNACATMAPQPETDDAAAQAIWQTHLQRLDGLTRWTLRGRVAVKAGSGSWQAHLVWRQHHDDYEIDLRSVLGRQLAQLCGGAAGVELRLSKGGRFRAADAEALLQSQLGWSLPVAGLRHWILGRPAPGPAGRRVLGGDGRLVSLNQDGWHIDYSRFLNVGRQMLPGRLVLVRDDLRLRLVVDAWELEGKPECELAGNPAGRGWRG